MSKDDQEAWLRDWVVALGITDDPGETVEAEDVVGRVADSFPLDGHGHLGTATRARRHALPFYENGALLVLSDPGWAPRGVVAAFLAHDDGIERLTGVSPPIHAANAALGPILTGDTRLAYLRFFCFFVRGGEGPFYLLEDAGSPHVPEESRAAVAPHATPAELLGRFPDGQARAASVVAYGRGLFVAEFAIESSGMVTMLQDAPLDAELPAPVTAPIELAAPR